MSAPMCPTHNSPMRPGNKGGYFCPRKMPDGSFCTSRAKNATPPPPFNVTETQISGGTPQGSAATTPRHLLVLAALDFAGKVYQGTGQDQGALGLAQAALHEFGTELL